MRLGRFRGESRFLRRAVRTERGQAIVPNLNLGPNIATRQTFEIGRKEKSLIGERERGKKIWRKMEMGAGRWEMMGDGGGYSLVMV